MVEYKSLWYILLFGLMLFLGCNSAEERGLDAKEAVESDGVNKARTQQKTLASKSSRFVLGKTLLGNYNGDRLMDTLQEIREGESAGYLAILSGDETPDTLGLGRAYGNLYDDFSWVDSWNVLAPGNYDEVTFSSDGDVLGSRKVTTYFVGIELLSEEVGGGILAWNKDSGWYWIHQTD